MKTIELFAVGEKVVAMQPAVTEPFSEPWQLSYPLFVIGEVQSIDVQRTGVWYAVGNENRYFRAEFVKPFHEQVFPPSMERFCAYFGIDFERIDLLLKDSMDEYLKGLKGK